MSDFDVWMDFRRNENPVSPRTLRCVGCGFRFSEAASAPGTYGDVSNDKIACGTLCKECAKDVE